MPGLPTQLRLLPDLAAFEEQRKALKALRAANAQELQLHALFSSDIPAQSAPTLRVLDGGRHPTGVAVLLEVTPRED